MNRNIKDKLKKATGGTLRNWFDFLPAILFQIRTSPHCRNGLSPYEILMGKPTQRKQIEIGEEPNLYSLQEEYVKNLVSSFTENYDKVAVTFPPLSTEPTHPFIPRDRVLVKQLAARRSSKDLFEVLKVARTAVLTDQSPQWIHKSRIKKAPDQ